MVPVVRRLLIDLEAPFERGWCGGDPFLTALFDALSMSFPVGEQFFIDSVRAALEQLPAERRDEFAERTRAFIGQEATHRRIHSLFNEQLLGQGLVNDWEKRALVRIGWLADVDRRHWLAATAAYEHLTAILAQWLLRNPHVLDGAEPRLRTMWLWHSAEETEHRSVAFDLHHAIGGDRRWRLKWFRRVTTFFLADVMRQTLSNLRRSGTLWQRRTWRSAAHHLFGRGGLARETFAPWREYFRADFHPDQRPDDLARRWIDENTAAYTVAGPASGR
ncbi:MAG: metal-dependent hydrolase [Burkholderiaceae bacterium]|nr:metal-dependent hydrolase [Burkholderiaceae bacterium]